MSSAMTFCPPQLISSEATSQASTPQAATPGAREEQAHALCLRQLTVRARTRAELAGQMAKRGYPDEAAHAVLARLEAVGLIDDEDFAEQWVRSRQAGPGKGKRALAAELRTKGVDDEVIALPHGCARVIEVHVDLRTAEGERGERGEDGTEEAHLTEDWRTSQFLLKLFQFIERSLLSG